MAPLHQRLANARDRLVRAGIAPAEAALDAEVLARHVLDCDRATFLIRARDPLPSAFDRLFEDLVLRRLAREPVAYITGHKEFWGLEFDVTPAVLIPRPETELIVEEALSAMPARDAVRRIIDVGTGSGCLAVALAIEFPSAAVLATDSSTAALEVAGRNLLRHNVTSRVSLVHTNLLEGIPESAELIVSNPPYVPERDAPHMQPEVIRYEPRTALFAGADGLDVIRRLFTAAFAYLAESGRLIVEFGLGQEDELRGASRETGWTVDHFRRDLQGIPRVAVLRR
ncbi:MAG TPA: peptide chain release factor N(5)-glutamine methyltransferase [Vicinamibacterales bacterium]|nr:peptide chain release factor N(5)-glutamine methyltransferase [Vicinamibacterales bacterium]